MSKPIKAVDCAVFLSMSKSDSFLNLVSSSLKAKYPKILIETETIEIKKDNGEKILNVGNCRFIKQVNVEIKFEGLLSEEAQLASTFMHKDPDLDEARIFIQKVLGDALKKLRSRKMRRRHWEDEIFCNLYAVGK